MTILFDIFPAQIKVESSKSYLFGIVKVVYICEDRLPRASSIEVLPRRYKHMVEVRIFTKSVLSLTIRSPSEGVSNIFPD